MYSPSHFRSPQPSLVRDIVTRYDFATLITTQQNSTLISHLPLYLRSENPFRFLGHLARANPQARALGIDATAIFQGPHGYISPAWYNEKPGNVPTWNYVAVHCRCQVRVVSDPTEAVALMNELVNHFENINGTSWSLPQPMQREQSELMKAITIFELEVLEVDAKFKLSQNQPLENRERVINNLKNPELSEWMKRVYPTGDEST